MQQFVLLELAERRERGGTVCACVRSANAATAEATVATAADAATSTSAATADDVRYGRADGAAAATAAAALVVLCRRRRRHRSGSTSSANAAPSVLLVQMMEVVLAEVADAEQMRTVVGRSLLLLLGMMKVGVVMMGRTGEVMVVVVVMLLLRGKRRRGQAGCTGAALLLVMVQFVLVQRMHGVDVLLQGLQRNRNAREKATRVRDEHKRGFIRFSRNYVTWTHKGDVPHYKLYVAFIIYAFNTRMCLCVPKYTYLPIGNIGKWHTGSTRPAHKDEIGET